MIIYVERTSKNKRKNTYRKICNNKEHKKKRKEKTIKLTESKFSKVARSNFLADTEVGTDHEYIRGGGDTIP